MAYSKAYQQVIAGRVIEDEDSFNKNNLAVSPARIYSSSPTGGKKQPTLDTNYMHDEGMGKKTGRKPLIDAYNPNSYNIGS